MTKQTQLERNALYRKRNNIKRFNADVFQAELDACTYFCDSSEYTKAGIVRAGMKALGIVVKMQDDKS